MACAGGSGAGAGARARVLDVVRVAVRRVLVLVVGAAATRAAAAAGELGARRVHQADAATVMRRVVAADGAEAGVDGQVVKEERRCHDAADGGLAAGRHGRDGRGRAAAVRGDAGTGAVGMIGEAAGSAGPGGSAAVEGRHLLCLDTVELGRDARGRRVAVGKVGGWPDGAVDGLVLVVVAVHGHAGRGVAGVGARAAVAAVLRLLGRRRPLLLLLL